MPCVMCSPHAATRRSRCRPGRLSPAQPRPRGWKSRPRSHLRVARRAPRRSGAWRLVPRPEMRTPIRDLSTGLGNGQHDYRMAPALQLEPRCQDTLDGTPAELSSTSSICISFWIKRLLRPSQAWLRRKVLERELSLALCVSNCKLVCLLGPERRLRPRVLPGDPVCVLSEDPSPCLPFGLTPRSVSA